MFDRHGPCNWILLSRNVLPPGTTMIGELASLHAAFHVAKNACRTEKKMHR
jgi:hypothetical protein